MSDDYEITYPDDFGYDEKTLKYRGFGVRVPSEKFQFVTWGVNHSSWIERFMKEHVAGQYYSAGDVKYHFKTSFLIDSSREVREGLYQRKRRD